MRRLVFVLSCSGCLPLMWGCQLGGITASSNSNTPTPAIGMQFAPPKGSSSKVDLGTAESPTVAQTRKPSSRVPTVKPAVHAAESETDIPSAEPGAEAAPPSGNFFSRMIPGKKQPAKRVPLPLAEGQSIQATNDEEFDGFPASKPIR